MSLRLGQLNIEGDNHLHEVGEFLQRNKPDVMCLQEVFDVDFKLLCDLAKSFGYLVPLLNINAKCYNLNNKGQQGIAILTNQNTVKNPIFFSTYYGNYESYDIPVLVEGHEASRALAWAEFTFEGKFYRVANTHFTWSAGGKTTEQQLIHLEKMLKILDQFAHVIFCADTNAPRGENGEGEIWSQFTCRYTDTVPEHIKSTLTPLHRVQPPPPVVVDGVFLSEGYALSPTEKIILDYTVSDHAAILALIDSFIDIDESEINSQEKRHKRSELVIV